MRVFRSGGRGRVLGAVGIVIVVFGAGTLAGILATRHASTSSVPKKPVPVTPLSIVSISPSRDQSGVGPSAPIAIEFSDRIAKTSALPTLSPSTSGSWSIDGRIVSFQPTEDFIPLAQVTLSIPAGKHGMKAMDGAHLAAPSTEEFDIANGSLLRIQQLLSLLDYSPLSFTQSGTAIAPSDSAAEIAALFSPPPGTFAWKSQGWPARLLPLFQAGVDTVFTKGLIMSFEADHGLYPDGTITAGLWNDLLSAWSSGDRNTGGYNYAIANKHTPETLTIWHNGRVVLQGPANTGIADAPTADGTFPVYARLRQQVMRGTNPDGAHYADLVQFIAYFNGNDAVHYMPRPDYGIPQSLGCVELPLGEATLAWPYLAYGTLVSVIN